MLRRSHYEGRSNRPFQPVSAGNAGRESLFIIKRPSHERTSASRDVRDAKRQATQQMNRNTPPYSTEMITRGKVSISAKRLTWSSPQTRGRVWGLVAGTNKGGRCLCKEQTIVSSRHLREQLTGTGRPVARSKQSSLYPARSSNAASSRRISGLAVRSTFVAPVSSAPSMSSLITSTSARAFWRPIHRP
jgi:hypothetical protein